MLRLHNKKGLIAMVGGALVLALVAVGAWGAVGFVSASRVTAADLTTMTQASASPGLLSDGYLSHGGGWGFPGTKGSIDTNALLADALGITPDKLDAAYATARTDAIEQAVEEGLLTREQADTMLVWGERAMFGFSFRGMERMPRGTDTGAIDEQALLAQALGISTEKLTAAREKANAAALAQAVEDGILTQEQADRLLSGDEMQSRQELASYVNRDALLAKALGMTLDELKAAYTDGETMSSLMAAKGLDAAAVRDGITEAYKTALAEAVANGVITQAQADRLLSGDEMGSFGVWGPGMPGRMDDRGGFGMPRGRGDFEGPGGLDGPRMPRGHGGFGDRGSVAPDPDDTGFRSPGHAMPQGDSDL